MSCEKHKRTIDKYNGSISELVEDIGNLHYETLAEFIKELSSKIERDAKKDEAAGRTQLSEELYGAAEYLEITSTYIEQAWVISKPYMNV